MMHVVSLRLPFRPLSKEMELLTGGFINADQLNNHPYQYNNKRYPN